MATPETNHHELQKNRRWKRGEPGHVHPENRELLAEIDDLISEDRRNEVLAIVRGWLPADVMELLILLPLRKARKLYDWLPPGPAVKVLASISPELRAVLMQESGIARIAAIADELDDDEAVELLAEFPDDLVSEVLPRLEHADQIRERLEFEEDTAGEVMSNKFVVVLDEWNVGTATRAIRRKAADIEKFYEVYVVDEARRLVGTLKLRDLLLHKKKVLIRDIMREVPVTVGPDADQEDVLELASRFRVQTIPVVDDDRHVIGRITVEELQEIARDEAEEDMLIMGGVSPDALPDHSLKRIIRARLPWLVGGLLGAVLAGLVVGSFEDELKQAAVLATFIPVVMAMAGNAGIQASTVTVQGLASGNLWTGDVGRRFARELVGSLINGVLVAALLISIVLIASRFLDIPAPGRLALAAGLSVALVTTMAATLGSTVPLLLDRFNIDPAVATGVFITTSNDILGVFVYFLVASSIYLGAH
ncbi:MAG: magnesium transporter [Woeseiaceae bacterium]|nr:magnesium transporter [Woeseiaceae bacterium]